MRTGVSGEDGAREVRYNCSLLGLLNHYGLIRAPVGRIGYKPRAKWSICILSCVRTSKYGSRLHDSKSTLKNDVHPELRGSGIDS